MDPTVLVVGMQANERPWDEEQRLMDLFEEDSEKYIEEMIARGAFNPSDWKRLESIGIDREECDTMNLVPPNCWNKALTIRIADRVILYSRHTHIVMCGRAVCHSFDKRLSNQEFGVFRTLWYDKLGIIVPHPSGLNRIWSGDTSEIEERVRLFLRDHPNNWSEPSAT